MADSKPELTIPIALDGAKALAELKRLQDALNKTGQTGQDSNEKLDKGTKTLTSSLGDLVKGYAAVASANNIASAVANSWKEAGNEVQRMTQQFLQLREQLQQVAALTNKDNNAQFTVSQAKAAEAAGLKTQDWVKFQENFQSYAGAYLEGDQAKLNEQDAERYQQALAKFAKARGINASEAAEAGGNILMSAEGPISDEEALKRFGRGYRTLERARTPVTQLLPQSTRLMAQGSNFEESAQLLGIQAEANPGEEGTYVENVVKALREATLKGTGAELGLKKGMTPLEQIQAAAETLDRRISGGEDEDQLLSTYFKDIREFKGMQGFISKGVRAGGFSRFRKYANETADNYVDQTNDRYSASEQGQFAQQQASLDRAEAEQGARYKDAAFLRKQAEAQLTEEGEFGKVNIDSISQDLANNLPVVGVAFNSHRERLINSRMLANAREMSGDSGVANLDKFTENSQLATDNQVVELLKRQNTLMEQDAQRQGNRPLAAPPPRFDGRIGGNGGGDW